MQLSKKNIHLIQLISVFFIGFTSKIFGVFDIEVKGKIIENHFIFYLLPYAFFIMLIPLFFKNLNKKLNVTLVMILLSLMSLFGNLYEKNLF